MRVETLGSVLPCVSVTVVVARLVSSGLGSLAEVKDCSAKDCSVGVVSLTSIRGLNRTVGSEASCASLVSDSDCCEGVCERSGVTGLEPRGRVSGFQVPNGVFLFHASQGPGKGILERLGK